MFGSGSRYIGNSKFPAFPHILELYLFDGYHIGHRVYLFKREGNLGQRVVEMYAHPFAPCRFRYSSQHINMVGGIGVCRIIQHHLPKIGEVRSGCTGSTVGIPREKLHTGTQQCRPVLFGRYGCREVGIHHGTCIEVLFRSG